MAINYTIMAEVVDITSDNPLPSDVFFVDTNVWYWMTYPAATALHQSQLQDYPNYLNRALRNGAMVCHSGLSMAELTHSIERTEHEIYEQCVTCIKTKEYRHNLVSERARVVSQVQAAWAQVCSLANPLPFAIDTVTTQTALNRLVNEKVDGYDLFLLESMKHNGIVQVITDDGDFSTVSGIKIFTANSNVIQAARTQGKLIRR
jgi:hypothetical protein